ncbi:MAG: hypothetical protein A2X64_06855 [Ignavibacteria bacterium GWF2_33_9]|nr:MAG: hypothetical protein A2X64_06855 [Ignavibacteria bacterium GWF2_33_9]
MSDFFHFPKKKINGTEYWEILDRDKLSEKKGVRVVLGDDFEYQIAVFLVNGKTYAVSNICPHRHQEKIFEGFIRENDKVMCPLHGWTYFLATGENTNPNQGVGSIQTFNLIELEGKIYLEKPEIKIPKWRNI